jgi:hypothetical protein
LRLSDRRRSPLRDDRGTPNGARAGLVIAVVRNGILAGPARIIARFVTRELLSEVERIVLFEHRAVFVPRE